MITQPQPRPLSGLFGQLAKAGITGERASQAACSIIDILLRMDDYYAGPVTLDLTTLRIEMIDSAVLVEGTIVVCNTRERHPCSWVL